MFNKPTSEGVYLFIFVAQLVEKCDCIQLKIRSCFSLWLEEDFSIQKWGEAQFFLFWCTAGLSSKHVNIFHYEFRQKKHLYTC